MSFLENLIAQRQGEVNAAKTKRTPRPRKWPWVLVGILVLLLVIVLLVPVILSSKGFTRWVQAKINSSTGGQTDIRNLSVGWFRGVQIAGFSYRGDNGGTAVDIDHITAMPSYAGLLSGTLALDRTVLNQPRVAIDMREMPPSSKKGPSVNMSDLERIGDVAVRDGSVQLTDTAGKMVQLASLNSDLSIRPPGRRSSINADMMVLAANQKPGRVTVVGEATPSKQTGWSLKGTTGDVTVEVNDLNLDSVAPFLDLAGLQMQARGQVSGNITSAIQDGQIQNLNATITGQDIDITGQALQGDRLQTSQLNVRASLTQSGDVIDVNQLDARTDWATVTLTGTVPKTPGSLSGLLESGAAYAVQGNFDINLAAVLSQMPHTLGVRPGMQITGGRCHGQHRHHHPERPGHNHGQGPSGRPGRRGERSESRSQCARADSAATLDRQTGRPDRQPDRHGAVRPDQRQRHLPADQLPGSDRFDGAPGATGALPEPGTV